MAEAVYRKLKKYKYQLVEDYVDEIPIRPDNYVNSRFIKLTKSGKLTIKNGYAWDGPSGPTIDTPTFMRGSLVHDALYQLIRERHLKFPADRKPADQLLRDICIADGMSRKRATYVYDGVRLGGGKSAKPRNKPKDKIFRVPPRR